LGIGLGTEHGFELARQVDPRSLVGSVRGEVP